MPIGDIPVRGLIDRDGGRLDSSEVLRGGNYRGTVREVALMNPLRTFRNLENAITQAHSLGYSVTEPTIVNVLHGDPSKNEPRAVINLVKRDSLEHSRIDASERSAEYLADAIITQNILDSSTNREFSIYIFGEGFRYVE